MPTDAEQTHSKSAYNDRQIVSMYQAGFTQTQIAKSMGSNQSSVARRLAVYEQKTEK